MLPNLQHDSLPHTTNRAKHSGGDENFAPDRIAFPSPLAKELPFLLQTISIYSAVRLSPQPEVESFTKIPLCD